MMETNFELTIEYDGTRYHGWQKQPNGPTIQQEIETAINTITGQTIRLTGSGRTDAGVHALAQTANFSCGTLMAPEAMMNALNSVLPDDIAIRRCRRVPLCFHARFNAISKIYCYHIANQPVRPAIHRQFSWWIRTPLDVAAMQKAATHLLGKHDFKSFEGAGSPRAHTVRNVMTAEVEQDPDGKTRVTIQADGFLRYMVRNIVGSLAAVGRNKIDPDGFREILMAKDRSKAAATAPPHGLFLMGVQYEDAG